MGSKSIVIDAKQIHKIGNIYADTITIKYESITIPLQELINNLKATNIHIVCKNGMYIKDKIVTDKNITLIALHDIIIGNEDKYVMILANNINIMCRHLDCSYGKIYSRKNIIIEADCVNIGTSINTIVELESYSDYNSGYVYKDKSESYIIAKNNLTIISYRLIVYCAFLSSLGNFTFQGNKLSCVASKIEVYDDFNIYAYMVYTVPCKPYHVKNDMLYETSNRSTFRVCGNIKCHKHLQWHDVESVLDFKSNDLINSIEFNKYSIKEFR